MSRICEGRLWLLAIAAGLLLAVSGVEPAGAQSEATVRVSNLGQSEDSQLAFAVGQAFGQAFTTGDTDVTLEKVRMHSSASGSTAGAPEVTVRTDDSGQPGATLVTLANPTLDGDMSTHEDFAGAEERLSANTTYWVVISRPRGSGTFAFSVTQSDAESTAEQGWSLGDRFLYQSGSGWWETFDYNIRVAVFASPAEAGGL